MPSACKVCAEPGVRDSVDRQLAEGVPIRDIAAVVHRSKSSVARHKLHGDDERTEDGIKVGVRPRAPRKRSTASSRAETTPDVRRETSSSKASSSSVHSRSNGRISSQAGRDAGRQSGQEAIETREHLVGRFESLLNEATEILALARRRGDSRLALQALKEARESVISIGKALGLVAPDGQTFINARRQSLRVLSKYSEEEMRSFIAATVSGTLALAPAEPVDGGVIDGAFEIAPEREDDAVGA